MHTFAVEHYILFSTIPEETHSVEEPQGTTLVATENPNSKRAINEASELEQ